jgi:lipoate-protein ligase A
VFTVAADEAICRARAEDLVPDTLHFYRRDRPTISMGYFQSVEKDIDQEYCKEHEIEVLRRASGGSTIYTDKDQLIYAFVSKNILTSDMNEAYQDVCSALITGLNALGIEAVYKPVNDILVDGKKVSGSAQMRKWGVVLQHGTIILDLDRETMLSALNVDTEKLVERGFEDSGESITSLKEVLGQVPDMETVKGALVSAFEDHFQTRFERSVLTGYENELIEQLISEKYGNPEWNLKR